MAKAMQMNLGSPQQARHESGFGSSTSPVGAEKAGYLDVVNGCSRFVEATAGLDRKLAGCETLEEKQQALRNFLEHGGLRSDIEPVTKRLYGSVLFLEKDVGLVVGTRNVVRNGGQRMEFVRRDLKAGLYGFNYDTEAGLTLHSLNDPEDVAQISLGFGSSRADRLSAKNADNTRILFDAVRATSRLYAHNRSFAAVMEQCNDALYGNGRSEGGAPWARGADGERQEMSVGWSGNMQNEPALKAIKATVRELLGAVEEKALADWTDRVHVMINPMSRTLLPVRGQDHVSMDMIRRELLLANGTVDNLHVGFDVKGGGVMMNLYSYADIDRERKWNPVLMYQVQPREEAARLEFPNEFTFHRSWDNIVDLRNDYDNRVVAGEVALESKLASYYRQRYGEKGEMNVFGIAITASPASFEQILSRKMTEAGAF